MRINKSEDGVPRFTLKLETRIGAYEMAVHLINYFQYEESMSPDVGIEETTTERDERIENRIKSLMSGLSKTKMLDIIRNSILTHGDEHLYFHSSDNGYSNAVQFLTGYIVRKYKGFQIND